MLAFLNVLGNVPVLSDRLKDVCSVWPECELTCLKTQKDKEECLISLNLTIWLSPSLHEYYTKSFSLVNVTSPSPQICMLVTHILAGNQDTFTGRSHNPDYTKKYWLLKRVDLILILFFNFNHVLLHRMYSTGAVCTKSNQGYHCIWYLYHTVKIIVDDYRACRWNTDLFPSDCWKNIELTEREGAHTVHVLVQMTDADIKRCLPGNYNCNWNKILFIQYN